MTFPLPIMNLPNARDARSAWEMAAQAMEQADPAALALNRRDLMGLLALGGAGMLLPEAAEAASAIPPALPILQSFVRGFVTRGNLPGVLVSVGRGFADPAYVGAGTLAFGSRVPVNKDTLWRIYSMTKPVTGIATMMLVDDGKLSLDQPLAEILPKYARMTVQLQPDGPLTARPAKTQITIRHLLTHTSGLGYSIMQSGPIKTAYLKAGLVPGQFSRIPNPFEPQYPVAPNLEVFADRLAALPLVYEPGTRWSYGMGLDLLGRVIEVVSGQRFDHFLKQRIFDPLGMASTGFVVPQDQVARLTTNYGIVGGLAVPIDPGQASVFAKPAGLLAGGAGLVSSARDYDRFLMMLLGEGRFNGKQLMSAQAARLAMSNLLPPGANIRGTWIEGYGFGAGGRVTLPTSKEGVGVFGWNGAAGTIGWVDRGRKMRVTGMVQQMPLDAYPFQSALPGIIQRQFAAKA